MTVSYSLNLLRMKSRGVKAVVLARLADSVSLVHLGVVIIAAFGWWLLPHHPLHLTILLATLASWLFTGSCILARVEYWLRRQYLSDVPRYEHGYLHFHLHRLAGYAPSLRFIRAWGYVYLTSASLLWIANFFLITA